LNDSKLILYEQGGHSHQFRIYVESIKTFIATLTKFWKKKVHYGRLKKKFQNNQFTKKFCENFMDWSLANVRLFDAKGIDVAQQPIWS
jgi:hypothetical protein